MAGNHLDVKAHVVRSGSDATRAVGGDDGGCFREAAKAREGVIVLEGAVVFCSAIASVERDNWLGFGHAERIKDALAVDVGQEAAVERHEQVTEKVESGVVVVKEFARSISGAMLCGRIGKKHVGNAGKTGSVREKVVDGDGFEGRIDWEPGQIVHERFLEVEFAFLMQLEQAVCKKAFADGADLEEMVWRDAVSCLDVAKAVSDDALNGVAIGEDEREAGSVHGADVGLDEGVERLEDGFVRGGRAFGQRFERKELRRSGEGSGCTSAKKFTTIHGVDLGALLNHVRERRENARNAGGAQKLR